MFPNWYRAIPGGSVRSEGQHFGLAAQPAGSWVSSWRAQGAESKCWSIDQIEVPADN
jgi:hypothetical protein